MKASIKFRDEQKPLMRAKIPLNVLNFPFQSGICAGETKELSLNLCTFFDSGPSLKFSYRPNDSQKPFSFVFKSGIGNFGSPTNSPLTMSAEFNLIGNQNPSFFIHFKPDFGDFSLKKSHSSGFVNLGEKLNGVGFVKGESFVGNGFFPVATESKAAAAEAAGKIISGTVLSARTSLPLRDFAKVNFRWGLRVPPQETVSDEVDAVVVRRRGEGIKLPLLVMNKIGIEHVAIPDSTSKKVGAGIIYADVAEACLDVKKKLDMIQTENSLLNKALSDLRSDIAAGKMDFLPEHHHRSKYIGGGVGNKKSFDSKDESKGA